MRLVASFTLAISFLASPTQTQAVDDAHAAVTILKENCSKCHGAAKTSGKLDVRTLDALIVGGKHGPAIVPGKASESRLIQVVQPDAKPHMPPGKKQLSDEAIQTLVDWVDGMVAQGEGEGEGEGEANQDEVQTTTALPPRSWLPPLGTDPSTVIDLLIQAGYLERDVSPNPVASDQAFVRRVYLDVIARIPSLNETQAFMASTDSMKRERLIDELVASDEFAKRMADAFDVILMGRNERRLGERKQRGWHAYLEAVFRENRSWDEVAREVLLARANSKERGHLWYLYERNNNHQDMAESIARGFFGLDIACAQCHDHPLADEIKQSHYWGLVAFFNRSKNANAENGFAVAESAIGGFNDFANALQGTTEQSSLLFLHRGPVHEERPEDLDKQEDNDDLYVSVAAEPRLPKFSRREKFVDEILDEHPLLARSMVNRVWALLMGRGIVDPPEKMDSTHPPSHPDLLEWLARDFHDNGYDVKRLVRGILKTRTYQLDSGAPEKASTDSFAFGLEKPLTAEALVNSIAVALEVDIDDQAVGVQFRKLFPDVLAENNLTSLKQTMMLSNRPELQQVFNHAAEKQSQGTSVLQQVRDWYARIFSREPSDEELFAVSDYLRAREDRPGQAMSQVLWAMVCSAEFRFNH